LIQDEINVRTETWRNVDVPHQRREIGGKDRGKMGWEDGEVGEMRKYEEI
jgi:hypothetical protein